VGWTLALLPFTLLALGVPIFLILLVTVIVLLAFFVNVPFTVIPQTMFGSIDKFALLAVPFFIFAGEVMGQGGISARLIRWMQSVSGAFAAASPWRPWEAASSSAPFRGRARPRWPPWGGSCTRRSAPTATRRSSRSAS